MPAARHEQTVRGGDRGRSALEHHHAAELALQRPRRRQGVAGDRRGVCAEQPRRLAGVRRPDDLRVARARQFGVQGVGVHHRRHLPAQHHPSCLGGLGTEAHAHCHGVGFVLTLQITEVHPAGHQLRGDQRNIGPAVNRHQPGPGSQCAESGQRRRAQRAGMSAQHPHPARRALVGVGKAPGQQRGEFRVAGAQGHSFLLGPIGRHPQPGHRHLSGGVRGGAVNERGLEAAEGQGVRGPDHHLRQLGAGRVQAGRQVDAQHRQAALAQQLDQCGKSSAQRRREAGPEQPVDDHVRVAQGAAQTGGR